MVSAEVVKNYVDHMKLLALKHEKRSSEKAQQRDAESRKTYKDYDLEGMFQEESLSKLKAVELDKYITYHKLGKLKTKKAKIEAIKWNLMRQLSRQIDQAIKRREVKLARTVSQAKIQMRRIASLLKLGTRALKKKWRWSLKVPK